jgi:cob(I)alamin adenosyltransferase
MKIYTKTGDGGETGLFGGGRVGKDHVRVDAYGEVDELNSTLGVAIVQLEAAGEAELAAGLRQVQADLFTVGAVLATPAPEDGGRENAYIPALDPARAEALERWIDAADAELEPLKSFILPGGTPAAALLHQARVIARRAERSVWALMEADPERTNPETARYLNRLSDLLFILAREANPGGDVLWEPGAHSGAHTQRAAAETEA